MRVLATLEARDARMPMHFVYSALAATTLTTLMASTAYSSALAFAALVAHVARVHVDDTQRLLAAAATWVSSKFKS